MRLSSKMHTEPACMVTSQAQFNPLISQNDLWQAPSSEEREETGEGVFPSPADWGLGEHRKLQQPKTGFGAFWAWTNKSGFDIFVIFIITY